VTDSLKDIISDLVDFFRPHTEGVNSVLDIGTGTSIPVHVFAENFPDIRFNTVDIVDIRKMKTLPFVLYDGLILPFGNQEFDVSLLNETLHHCADPVNVLSEAARTGKSVYVIEHFPMAGYVIEELVKTEFNALKKFEVDTDIYKPFTEDSIQQLFEIVNLTILDKIEIPYYGERKIEKYLFKLKCR
jgi:ubiquinone/menaquinone biosynthesis C-methylase UbiE